MKKNPFKYLKSILTGLCFLAIFAVFFLVTQELLRDKWTEGEYNVTTKVKGFYAEPADTIDVVFVGSSQMYADMAPGVLFEQYGISSYDFCANEQPLWVSYSYIREAVRTQHPKVIVLDVFTVYGDTYAEEGVTHINLDDLPMNANKIEAIQNSVPKELCYSFFFPIAKYHNTWSDLSQAKWETAFYSQRDPNKGYSPFVFAGTYEKQAKEEVKAQQEKQTIPAMSLEWLEKINALCKAEDVALVLTKTPNGNAEREKFYNTVEALAREWELPFVNMNEILDGQAHINVIQARKVSEYMGEYLNKHYELPDHRGEEAYASYEKAALLFRRNEKKCEVLQAQSLRDYFQILKDENYVVLIASKNTGNNAFSGEDCRAVNEALGLHCSLQDNSGMGYLAIVDGGRVCYESGAGAVTDDVTLDVDSLQINMHSDGNLTDGKSSIVVNGTDFSMDCDGFNIAVYDKVLGEMFEMSAFDLTNGMSLIRN